MMFAYADRSSFLRKVYMHLMVAILAFVGIEFAMFNSGFADQVFSALAAAGKNLKYVWMMILIIFTGVGTIASGMALSKSRPMQYVGLLGYVLIEALIFIPILHMAKTYSDPTVIPSAAVITLTIFAGLSLYVLVTGRNFEFLGGIISVLCLVSLGVIFSALLLGLHLGVFFSAAMIALSAMMVLYDTSKIAENFGDEDYVGASLSLFASIALMFWYVLRIMMSTSSSSND